MDYPLPRVHLRHRHHNQMLLMLASNEVTSVDKKEDWVRPRPVKWCLNMVLTQHGFLMEAIVLAHSAPLRPVASASETQVAGKLHQGFSGHDDEQD